jgi:outer membrane lipoprotein SlyB
MNNATLSASPGQVTATPLVQAMVPRKWWVGGATALVAAGSLASVLVMQRAPVHEPAAAPTAPSSALSAAPAGGQTPSQAPARAPAAAAGAQGANAGRQAAPAAAPAAMPCNQCGTVQSAQAVRKKGQATGVGAVAGGVLGGIVGNQFGKGKGRSAMTVIGAVGGGVAGHEIEKRQRATTVYDVAVRMDDGQVRHFTRSEPWAVGQRVTVDGNALHSLKAAPQATAQASTQQER